MFFSVGRCKRRPFGIGFLRKQCLSLRQFLMSPAILRSESERNGGMNIRHERSTNGARTLYTTFATSTARQKVMNIKIDERKKNFWIYAWFAWTTFHRNRTCNAAPMHSIYSNFCSDHDACKHRFCAMACIFRLVRSIVVWEAAPWHWISVKINSSELLKITIDSPATVTRCRVPEWPLATIVVKTINSQFRQKLNWKF